VVGNAERIADSVTVKTNTAELRLVSNGDQNLSWTVGGYYKDDKRKQTNSGLIVSVPAFGLPDDRALNTTPASNKASALFGDAEYKLNADIAVQAGLRHYKAKNATRIEFLTTSVVFPGNTAGDVQAFGGSASATSPKLGVSWKLRPDVLLFAKFSSGFRDGDSNFQAPNEPLIPASYKPEKIRAYELGIKSQPLPWLTVNGSVYVNDWTDLQLRFSTPDGLWGYVQNAGKARSTGAEIEFAARPMTGLRLGLNLASIDAKISQNVINTVNAPGGGTVSRVIAAEGSRIPFSPRLQASASAAYEFALIGNMGAVFSANFSHRGETYSDPANTEGLKNRTYDNLYLKAGVNGDNWGAALFVSNATNSTATQAKALSQAGGYFLNTYVQPRTVGVELSAHF
jgi:outer membrane receptor protein involved in Fe transport